MPDSYQRRSDQSSAIQRCVKDAGNLWGIVLTEDQGRKRDIPHRLSGPDLFKQYCGEVEHRNMVQRTLERVSPFVAPDKRLVLTCRDHVQKGLEEIRESVEFVRQPRNCDTAPGVLLTLLRIQDQDPDAPVAIFPAEHCAFIPDDAVFMTHVLQGIKFVTAYPHLLVLLGTVPERPEPTYAWIEPGRAIAQQSRYGLWEVHGIHENPDAPILERLYLEGGLWNSLIVLARLPALLGSFQKTLPELWERFQRIEGALENAHEGSMLEDVYRGMPVANFSRHVLYRIPQGLGVVPVTRDLSSDWKKQQRMFEMPPGAKAGEAEEVLSWIQRRDRRWENAA